MSNDVLNFGPGELDTGGDSFILTNKEMHAVQRYVNSAVNLPTDIVSLNKLLTIPYPKPDELDRLFGTYKSLHDHCKYWKDNTLPSLVDCAADIENYNDKVSIYFGSLNDVLTLLNSQSPDEQVVEKYKAIINEMLATAQSYENHASQVADQMNDFVTKCETDSQELKTTMEIYDKLYGDDSDQMKTMLQQSSDMGKCLNNLQKQYEHFLTTAVLSATYVWIFPFGTIAAAVVASIYGYDASDDQKQIRKTMESIRDLRDNIKVYAEVMYDLHQIEQNLGDIKVQLTQALQTIQKFQGAWHAIFKDLKNILSVIDEGIDKAPYNIKELGITNAIRSWDKVAHLAQIYRVSAYITIVNEESVIKVGMLQP